MASVKSTSTFKLSLIFPFVFCFILLNSIQTSHAASRNNFFNPTEPKKQSAFNWRDQKTLLPSDPARCTESFRQAGVCLTDFWTNFGRPSAKCCEALKNIDSSCLPAIMPLLNPFIGPFLESVCSFVSGSTSGAFPFPFPPFPFQSLSGAGATLPPPPLYAP